MENIISEISRVKTLMDLKEEKQVYNYIGTSQGGKSFTYKLDRDFISESGEDVILIDANNPENIHEFKVGKDIKKSHFRPNEVYSSLKKIKIVETTDITIDDCKDFELSKFEKIMKNGYIYKFNNTPLVDFWHTKTIEPTLNQKDKLKKGLNVLETYGYLNNQEKNDLYQKIIKKHKFVFDENGNWLSINKITGNLFQFIQIIAKILAANFNDNEAKEIYCKIISNENPNTVIDVDHRKYFEDKINSLGFDWLKNQTEKIDYFSSKGKFVETEFLKRLLSKNPDAKVLYEGGDGDLFDISLSIDLIVDFGPSSKLGVKTIQIKASKNAYEMMKVKYDNRSDFYKYIDWVVYPKPEGGWELVKLK
jgi:hypothetical protein